MTIPLIAALFLTTAINGLLNTGTNDVVASLALGASGILGFIAIVQMPRVDDCVN